jgi:molecular chaperone HscB
MHLTDTDFVLFDLPQQYAIDLHDLHNRWKLALSASHPDRFTQAGATGQRLAMQWSLRLNEAYQRLKHPLKRAAYLCSLQGVAIDSERNTAMPVDFLMRQMHWREALDGAKTAQDQAPIKIELLNQALQYQQDIQTALDIDHAPKQAADLVRAWMFVDKLLKTL